MESDIRNPECAAPPRLRDWQSFPVFGRTGRHAATPGRCDTLSLMGRSLLAVFGGWLVIQLLILATDSILMRLFSVQDGSGLPAPDWMLGLRLAYALIFTMLGGWVAARLAPERPWRHAVYLILLGETMGVVMAGGSLGTLPLWYFGTLLLLFPPAVLAGAWLRLRTGPRSTGG